MLGTRRRLRTTTLALSFARTRARSTARRTRSSSPEYRCAPVPHTLRAYLHSPPLTCIVALVLGTSVLTARPAVLRVRNCAEQTRAERQGARDREGGGGEGEGECGKGEGARGAREVEEEKELISERHRPWSCLLARLPCTQETCIASVALGSGQPWAGVPLSMCIYMGQWRNNCVSHSSVVVFAVLWA